MPVSAVDMLRSNYGKAPEEAGFFWSSRGPLEVAERTWFLSKFSGVIGFETDEGIFLVDSGLESVAPALASQLRSRTRDPIHTVALTQGHLDHAYGVASFLAPGQPEPVIIAQRCMPARFERYSRTAAHNKAINARQYGSASVSAAGSAMDGFGPPKLGPNKLYDERLDLEVGGVGFELHHCRGETDDHTWVWCPSRSVLCPGDLFIWAAPNAGNPQKVQRYPLEWAAGLREMARLQPRTLCPGHGAAVVDDPELIQRMLLETAEFLETIVERTLAVLNAGSPPHVDILHAVELPRSDSPWLRQMYDDAEFIVHNVIRLYGGWWNGRPSELKPAPRLEVAGEIAALAGGARSLVNRARELADRGDLRVACHLADLALEADPDDPDVQDFVAGLYESRSGQESAMMAINLFSAAADFARRGRPFA